MTANGMAAAANNGGPRFGDPGQDFAYAVGALEGRVGAVESSVTKLEKGFGEFRTEMNMSLARHTEASAKERKEQTNKIDALAEKIDRLGTLLGEVKADAGHERAGRRTVMAILSGIGVLLLVTATLLGPAVDRWWFGH